MPDVDARSQILDVYLEALDHDVDVASVARRTEGMSGADLREVVRGALLAADADLTTSDVLAQIPRRATDEFKPAAAGPDVAKGVQYL
jgi:SpoVK/Ycf46/Vps4 family AAA+-type ATPase